MARTFLLRVSLFVLFSPAFLQSQNFNVSLRAYMPFPGQTLANIWGHTDSLGNEYALVGCSKGLAIVNINDPSNPKQVKFVYGQDNFWKEIKTWNRHAYVTSEGGGGLQVINLSKLPDTTQIQSKYWAPAIGAKILNNIHALHIDSGFAYLYGSNCAGGGAVIADLSDPWNPALAGTYEAVPSTYVHDGYVRNNRLYAGHIYGGFFSVVDVTNKAAPVVLQAQNTPGNFTHNTWLTDDGNTLLTTDEVDDSYLTAYDITNLGNITELDRFRVTPGSGSLVHNTHVRNDWAVNSWYRDGFTIVDVHRPQNMVLTGWYDTHPGTGSGFDGAWGVYPFFASGTIVVSNIDEGLYVFTPVYTRACYLEGNVTDSVCGNKLNNVEVSIVSTAVNETTDLNGDYKTGYHIPGTYTVQFIKPGYGTLTVNNVSLDTGAVTSLNVKLFSTGAFTLSGNVKQASDAAPVANAGVLLQNANFAFSYLSDASGNFSQCGVFPGTYNLYSGKWGYLPVCRSESISLSSSSVNIQLEKGLYDDFMLDYGWNVSGNAAAGNFVRAIPAGAPIGDITGDCSGHAYVTGNADGNDDLDGGYTELASPLFDLTSYTQPYLRYSRWFTNNNNPEDSLVVYLHNGLDTVILEVVKVPAANWTEKIYKLKDYINPTVTMKLRFRVNDAGSDNRVETGIDKFYITEGPVNVEEWNRQTVLFSIFPNPFSGETIIRVEAGSESLLEVFDITGRVVERFKIAPGESEFSIGSSYAPGMYVVKVNEEKGKLISAKIIKY